MDAEALGKERLFANLYQELHGLARRALRRDGSLLTIGTTTLLHESYLSISKSEFYDAGGFLAYAARTMRGLIVDETRRRLALKRGAGLVVASPEPDHEEPLTDEHEAIGINDALEHLALMEPELAELVELRYFCGLSLEEIGALRGVTRRTMQRQWKKARLFLFHRLSPSQHSF